ncbi:putative LAS seventeen-binding protein [Chaetomium sp. MPI-SDFR-AT-0129]|nr:putative LAS seventeen-binding protein [Chaetomium sp. MPI-SDFR-AT-0129]
MYRVSALLPSWDRSRQNNTSTPPVPPVPTNAPANPITARNTIATSTPATNSRNSSSGPAPQRAPVGALTKVFGWAGRVVPATRLNTSTPTAVPTRYGRETYWPTNLDKECDKAARIIKSFCFDGFLSQDFEQTEKTDTTEDSSERSETDSKSETNTTDSTPTLNYITKKIPPRIIQNAVGLAVFSCMRSGLWMSGSGGAGLITARKADGTWSPPSAIILHTAELAFVMGVDIYDCVLVINSVQTLEFFTRSRLVLGEDVSLAVGPLVAAGGKEPEIKWKEINDTVLTYVKARGKHQAVELDGSMVTERANENERFYCEGVTILDILAGNIPKNVPEMRPLFEVIKAAEGRSDFDKALMDWLAQQPAPGDADIASPRESIATLTSPTKLAFGVPDASDPDPFGVIGLEMAGIEIREAGSKLRPASTQFEYQPGPNSPLYGRFSRQSMDTFVSRSNRGSCMSARTQATTLTDAYTQTDTASSANTTFSRANSDDGKEVVERLPTVMEPDEVDYTQVDTSIIEKLKRRTMEFAAPKPVPSEPTPAPETAPAAEPSSKTLLPINTATPVDNDDNAAAAADLKTPTASTPAETGAETSTPTAIDVATIEPVEITETLERTTAEVQPEPSQPADQEISTESPNTATAEAQDDDADDEDDEDDEDDDEGDEAVICEVATAAARPARTSIQRSQVTHVIQAKGAIVNIPKRIPPPLPARSPARASRGSYGDVSSLKSPLRNSFLSVASRTSIDAPSVDGSPSSPASSHAIEYAESPSPKRMPQPINLRHTKNSSSVSTTVAVDALPLSFSHSSSAAALPAEIASSPSETKDEAKEESREEMTPPLSASSPVPPTPRTLEHTSSADDDSDKEPTTPQTAETDFDTASERQESDDEDVEVKAQPKPKHESKHFDVQPVDVEPKINASSQTKRGSATVAPDA